MDADTSSIVHTFDLLSLYIMPSTTDMISFTCRTMQNDAKIHEKVWCRDEWTSPSDYGNL